MRHLTILLWVLAVCVIGFLGVKRGGSERPSKAHSPPVVSENMIRVTNGSLSETGCETCHEIHPGSVCSMYGGGKIMTIHDLPPGKIRSTVKTLPLDAQQRALLRLSQMSFRSSDEPSLRVDRRGDIYYVCSFTHAGKPALAPSPAAAVAACPAETTPIALGSLPQYAPVSVRDPPLYHSKIGSTNVLFLDFNGHDVSNTAWNSEYKVTAWRCTAFDLDSDTNTFSDTEQRYIRQIWERVSEDYSVFNVDVTTEQPAVWTRNTAHALITPNTDAHGVHCPHYGYGGIAYAKVFSDAHFSYNESNCYSPAWIPVLENYTPDDLAEAVSHELGHNLGLSHDGDNANEYYEGHSNGSISWAPIMGASYGRNVTQWSKGEYYQANRLEDDLAILASKLQYNPDDYSNTITHASPVLTFGGVFAVTGVVERTGDSDLFSFTCMDGILVLTGATYRCSNDTWGGNGDLVMRLYDAGGTLMASNNPVLETMAVITQTVTAGTYYLNISPTGVGNPMSYPPSGYTSYGSIGPYRIGGSVPLPYEEMPIPDPWKLHYFGTTNVAGWVDSDGDGLSNLQEYISGFDPTNRASFFNLHTLETPAASSSEVVIRWIGLTGRVYSVHWTTNLLQNFQSIETNLIGPQSSYTDTVHTSERANFYKIQVQLAPQP